MSRLQEFKTELKELLEKYKACLCCNIEGDTHGIMTEFEISVDNEDDSEIYEYQSHIMAEDI